MAASADRAMRIMNPGERVRLPADQDILYEGCFGGSNGGNVRALNAGDLFVGIVAQQVDNGSGSAGAKTVELITGGLIEHSVTGLDGVNHLGDIVYASADDTLTLTASTNTPVGTVQRYLTGTTGLIRLWTITEQKIYAAGIA